jgi:lambda repressor-like predicted transcriptional regulator
VPERECFTYRISDTDGTVLYVGMTYDVIQRMAQHSSKPWFPSEPRISVRRYPNRQAAAEGERALIAELRPLHNVRPFTYRMPDHDRRVRSQHGRHIVTALRRARMTQAELARRTGNSPSTISRIISGEIRNVPVADLIAIAEAIGVRGHQLFDGNFDCDCPGTL